jgi:hypothetical protein
MPHYTRSKVDQHVVRQYGRVQEDEEAVFGGFNGRNVAPEAYQCGPKGVSDLTEGPPPVSIFMGVFGAASLGLPFLFHVVKQVLNTAS